MQRRRHDVQRQQLPEKPLRPAGPERQRRQMLPVGAQRSDRPRSRDRSGNRPPASGTTTTRTAADRSARSGRTGTSTLPLRLRLDGTNRPDRKNISDIRLTSCQAQNRSKPNKRWLSTIGMACQRYGASSKRDRPARQRSEIGQNGMKRQHDNDHNRAQIAQGDAGSGHCVRTLSRSASSTGAGPGSTQPAYRNRRSSLPAEPTGSLLSHNTACKECVPAHARTIHWPIRRIF